MKSGGGRFSELVVPHAGLSLRSARQHDTDADARDAAVVVDQTIAIAVEEVQVPVEVIAERHAVVEFDCALAGGRVAAQQQRRQMFACEQFLLQANLSVAVVMLDVGIVVALGVGRIFLGVFRDPIPGLQVQQGVIPLMVGGERSDEHTSELQSLMRISYAVFCLNTKNRNSTV